MKNKKHQTYKRKIAMTDRFIAIRVGQGDAFYLERGGRSALVDGGKSVDSFPNQFRRATGGDSVNYLVCTHNDADHANGILGFLQAGMSADEVWLPGTWADHLTDILKFDDAFINELVANCSNAPTDDGKVMSLPSLGNLYSVERNNTDHPHRDDTRNKSNTEFQPDLDKSLEDAMRTPLDRTSILPAPIRASDWRNWLFNYFVLKPDRFALFLDAIEAAQRIRSIAIAAYENGIPIRWFEYKDSVTAKGGNDILRPVNAVEFALTRKPKIGLLRYLSLSVANRESLVFESPRSKDFPGALFLADSDLSFAQSVPADCRLITAPHHGSEHNSAAYSRLVSEGAVNQHTIWIRSDGNFKSRPGNSYLRVVGRKFCTLCRGAPKPKQDLIFSVVKSSWKRGNDVAECSC